MAGLSKAKQALKDRLIEEGRWTEFVAKRKLTTDRLIFEGKSRREAANQAWSELEPFFPPSTLGATVGSPPSGPTVNPAFVEDPAVLAKDRAEALATITGKDRVKEQPITHSVQMKLVHAAKGRKASPLVWIQWVFDHTEVGWDEIKPEEVPCAGAITMLKQAKTVKGLDAFLKDFLAKTIPTRQSLDEGARHEDDGRGIAELATMLADAAEKGFPVEA